TKCTSRETALSWNQTGPAGPAGRDGARGADGKQGAPGKDGSTWFTGDGVTAVDATGQIGDLYLDNSTGDVYRKLDTGWTLVTNIHGQAGRDGTAGAPGKPGAPGQPGSA